MTTTLSRRLWLQRSAMAAAILPVSNWYRDTPDLQSGIKTNIPNGAIRLNANENAYGPSEAARKAIMESLSEANRYPREFIGALKEEVAKREEVSTDHILITAGSTELLGLAGLTFGINGGELLACHPTFDFLLSYATKIGCTWSKTPLDKNYQYDLGALSNATGTNTKLLFICNPNNPTGVELPFEDLKLFCETYATKYPVFIDEAYIELSPNGIKSSMATLIEKLPYLIVSRTFSKVHGLAGMRVGYAIAQPDIINAMNNLSIGRSQSLSVPAAAAAMACLKDSTFENFSRNKIIEGRNVVCKAFDQWGVQYLPSSTNFVFFKNDKFKMDPVKAMEQENILIRKYDYVQGWTRVSIGTVEQMNTFVSAAGKYIG